MGNIWVIYGNYMVNIWVIYRNIWRIRFPRRGIGFTKYDRIAGYMMDILWLYHGQKWWVYFGPHLVVSENIGVALVIIRLLDWDFPSPSSERTEGTSYGNLHVWRWGISPHMAIQWGKWWYNLECWEKAICEPFILVDGWQLRIILSNWLATMKEHPPYSEIPTRWCPVR